MIIWNVNSILISGLWENGLTEDGSLIPTNSIYGNVEEVNTIVVQYLCVVQSANFSSRIHFQFDPLLVDLNGNRNNYIITVLLSLNFCYEKKFFFHRIYYMWPKQVYWKKKLKFSVKGFYDEMYFDVILIFIITNQPLLLRITQYRIN